jgi:hypothetical protein
LAKALVVVTVVAIASSTKTVMILLTNIVVLRVISPTTGPEIGLILRFVV